MGLIKIIGYTVFGFAIGIVLFPITLGIPSGIAGFVVGMLKAVNDKKGK